MVAKSHEAPLLMDVSTRTDVPAGVVCDQRITDPVTGAPDRVTGSLSQIPDSGLNAVDADAVVDALPVGIVTAVDTENVALPADETALAGEVAVADTSEAAASVMPMRTFPVLSSAPYWTE